jgi:hypothetical protein
MPTNTKPGTTGSIPAAGPRCLTAPDHGRMDSSPDTLALTADWATWLTLSRSNKVRTGKMN